MIVLIFVLTNASPGVAAGLDPTMPSDLITSRLTSVGRSTSVPVLKPRSMSASKMGLQLKAIVLRDHTHGTAIISRTGTKDTIIKLRRENDSIATTQVNFSGQAFIVKDFSNTSIVLQHTETKQEMIVK